VTVALVTGANGFCGRHLVGRLLGRRDVRVVGLDLAPAALGTPRPQEYLQTDLCDADQAQAAVERTRPDLVFHLAGLMDGDAAELYRVNLLGGVYLLEALRRHAADARVLVVGSAAEYGLAPAEDMPLTENHPCRPRGPYGISKHALTLAALDYAHGWRMKVMVARPFNIVGAGVPGSLVVGAVLGRIKQALDGGEPVARIGNLDTQRDFVAVEDAADAYVRLLDCEAWGEVFNVCSGRPRSIRWLVERLLGFSERPIRLAVDPALVRPADAPVVYGSWEKSHRAAGFRPSTPLDSALQSAWECAMGTPVSARGSEGGEK
jgi:GDP-4-dehydro-6-deoxy-D-mannose reductase